MFQLIIDKYTPLGSGERKFMSVGYVIVNSMLLGWQNQEEWGERGM
jgi:hypothetical protein